MRFAWWSVLPFQGYKRFFPRQPWLVATILVTAFTQSFERHLSKMLVGRT